MRDRVIEVGNAYSGKKSQCGVVYSISGISPTVCCGENRWGGLAPKIMTVYETI